MKEAKIIDVGRGPQIEGSRITVFEILDYLRADWHPVQIALLFRISSRQVDAAVHYIDEHKDVVMEQYNRILERCARGNPPELQAKLDATHERVQAMMSERRKAKDEGAHGSGHSVGGCDSEGESTRQPARVHHRKSPTHIPRPGLRHENGGKDA